MKNFIVNPYRDKEKKQFTEATSGCVKKLNVFSYFSSRIFILFILITLSLITYIFHVNFHLNIQNKSRLRGNIAKIRPDLVLNPENIPSIVGNKDSYLLDENKLSSDYSKDKRLRKNQKEIENRLNSGLDNVKKSSSPIETHLVSNPNKIQKADSEKLNSVSKPSISSPTEFPTKKFLIHETKEDKGLKTSLYSSEENSQKSANSKLNAASADVSDYDIHKKNLSLPPKAFQPLTGVPDLNHQDYKLILPTNKSLNSLNDPNQLDPKVSDQNKNLKSQKVTENQKNLIENLNLKVSSPIIEKINSNEAAPIVPLKPIIDLNEPTLRDKVSDNSSLTTKILPAQKLVDYPKNQINSENPHTQTKKKPSSYDIPIKNLNLKPPKKRTSEQKSIEKIDYCSGNVDPFEDLPVESFQVPPKANLESALKWKKSVSDMVKKISKLKIGGEPLREAIRDEIQTLKILRFNLFWFAGSTIVIGKKVIQRTLSPSQPIQIDKAQDEVVDKKE